ncbi:hypothetical protein HanPSC8_Chr09g0359861 [Helianthus annuus]|nr:hypothetical protein HanPSC8_Chr09g0359861 [Helianthus annuus]
MFLCCFYTCLRITIDILKSKVHGWSLWFTNILDLVPSFSKIHGWFLVLKCAHNA